MKPSLWKVFQFLGKVSVEARQGFARGLRAVAGWVDVAVPDDFFQGRVRLLIQEAEQSFEPGYGEAKRHAVYARLLKEFPTRPKGQLGLAIELAIQQGVR